MNAFATSWVVYLKTFPNKPAMMAVCEQGEWEEIELGRPGLHTLVQGGFTSEGQAEMMARAKPEIESKWGLKPRS